MIAAMTAQERTTAKRLKQQERRDVVAWDVWVRRIYLVRVYRKHQRRWSGYIGTVVCESWSNDCFPWPHDIFSTQIIGTFQAAKTT